MVKENKKRSTNTRVKKKEHSIAYFDYSLLAILICLICFGLVMLYSTSSYSAMMKQNGDSLFYFKRQVLFCIVGLIGMWIVSRIDYHWYFERSKFFYFISIFMMFLVKTPLGKEVNGAKRWIKLPFEQQLQPAEIAKIAIILFIPALICTMGREIKTLEGIEKVLAWGGFFSSSSLYYYRKFKYGNYCYGNYMYYDFCGTSKDKNIYHNCRRNYFNRNCRCEGSWYGNGDQWELPPETYSGMAESREICIRRRLPDHAGIVRNWIRRIFWKRSW